MRDLARRWLLWPDADILWTTRAVRAAADAAPWRPDWLFTTSPPESAHAAGYRLKRRWPLARWAADLRDHWLDAPHVRTRLNPVRRFGESLIARAWLRRADMVCAVDGFIAEEARALGARDPVVLPHFRPSADSFEAGRSRLLPEETINIVHAGSFSLSDPLTDISDLLRPFDDARLANPRLRLHLIGRLTDAEIALTMDGQAADAIFVHGVQPYEETLSAIADADGLAYVASSKAVVPPSKIVEYLAATAPILACGDGPWREDSRVADDDPASAMAALTKGATRDFEAPPPPSAADTARDLMNAMRAATHD